MAMSCFYVLQSFFRVCRSGFGPIPGDGPDESGPSPGVSAVVRLSNRLLRDQKSCSVIDSNPAQAPEVL